MLSGPVDIRQIVGVLASESRALLWAKVVVAADEGGDPVRASDLPSARKRDLSALERAGLVAVSEDRVRPSHDALREALKGASRDESVDVGPERFLVDGVLESMPRRTKDRVEILEHLSREIFRGPHAVLSESDVMMRLKCLASDPVGVRRALVDFGFVGRERDGTRYWLLPRQ